MSERKRLFLLISIMTAASLIVAGVTIVMLYRAAFSEERARLVESAQSQARLIEAIARFAEIHQKKWHPHVGVPSEATLSQVIEAHKHYLGFGKTGEFTLARREGDNIIFLLQHRHGDLGQSKPISFDSHLADPMRAALQGKSGTLIGHDYRGEPVLAAHEPLKDLNYGIVAKIDLAEVRAPFVRAGAIALGFMVLVVLAGAISFVRITKPVIKRLENYADELQKAHDKLEERVEKRTEELSRANTLLTQEITERKKTGEALKQSENELRRLSTKLLTAHAEESKRIGQELHDGLAQTLSAVKIWVENAIIELGHKNSVEAAKSLESVVPLTRGAVEEVRRISRNLRPSSLDDLGLLATISWSCREFRTLYPKIEMEEQIEIEEDHVPDSLKIVIYRVLQEALNNIAKHSRANIVHISLKGIGSMIEMIIDDNGEGFEMGYILSHQRVDRGLGITGMKERTELSGGSFLIESSKGVGTTVRASWTLT